MNKTKRDRILVNVTLFSSNNNIYLSEVEFSERYSHLLNNRKGGRCLSQGVYLNHIE